MAFRNRKTLKKNKYAKKTAKRRTWKGGVPPPRQRHRPDFMEPTSPPGSPPGFRNISPIRPIQGSPPSILDDSDIHFSESPPTTPPTLRRENRRDRRGSRRQ